MHEICFGVFDVRCTTLRIPSFLMYSAMGHDKGKSCENVLKCVAPFFNVWWDCHASRLTVNSALMSL